MRRDERMQALRVVALGVVSLVAVASPAQTQIKPRVLVVIDTSASMTEETNTTSFTGGDGSLYYESDVMTRTGMYRGFMKGAAICPNPLNADFRGDESRFFAAKAALANVVNGSGDIDWGLMRYAGTECADPNGDGVYDMFATTPAHRACGGGAECGSGTCATSRCACTSDAQCRAYEFCIGGFCGKDPNLCGDQPSKILSGETSTRDGQACQDQLGTIGVTEQGGCGMTATALSPGCTTPQTCFADAECTGGGAGRCALLGGGPARSCTCADTVNHTDCPQRVGASALDYNCIAGRCVYARGCVSNGGRMLVDPTAAGYRADQIVPWTDGVEIYRSNGMGGVVNPELHPATGTPLAGAQRAATAWYQAIASATVGSPLFDPKLLCRPYITILLTDGADTCEDTATGNRDVGSIAAVKGFVGATAQGAARLNRVEVIGFSITSSDQPKLNAMAQAGDPNRSQARFVTNQAELEAALGDIVAQSVLFEICNGVDDTCNDLVDEGLGVYQECTSGGQCPTGTCSQGRCACTGGAANQCAAGFACNVTSGAGFCAPSCTVGTGACLRSGIRKCGGDCCVNDGLAACTPLLAGPTATEVCNAADDDCDGLVDEGNVCSVCQPTAETCDGKDNDCDGIIDDELVDVGLPCGSDEGECQQGTTACQPTSGSFPNATDRIVCLNEVGPANEVCDGRDNNCDGTIDGMTRACFSGPAPRRGVGACRDGVQTCTATPGSGVESWGACTGEVLPSTEVCNGIDDDCDGVVDNAAGTGAACCPSGKCGTGVCAAGTMQCSGGNITCVGDVGPSQEACDGVDNDCNGTVDDVAGVGASCVPTSGSCAGHLVCDALAMALSCVADPAMPEVCNGLDDDCDGGVDELPDVATNDPRVGLSCDEPVAPANLPPCKAGATACQGGRIVCEGAVSPGRNVCGYPSRDCQTAGFFNGDCEQGFVCFQGMCDPPCSGGEHPCPGGYLCDPLRNLCIPDACAKLTCAPGTYCQLGADGAASCVDPCDGVDCPAGYRCKEGLCIDDSCKWFGCPEGELCGGDACVPDPCASVTCDGDTYCSRQTGTCVRVCVGPCGPYEICEDGTCIPDPCPSAQCPSGQACLVTSGVAMCVPDQCAGQCNLGAACCGGACIPDPCAGIDCPGDATCQLNSLCHAICQRDPRDQVVGAGGGGFACDVSAGLGARRAASPSTAIMMLLSLALLARRRRQDARR